MLKNSYILSIQKEHTFTTVSLTERGKVIHAIAKEAALNLWLVHSLTLYAGIEGSVVTSGETIHLTREAAEAHCMALVGLLHQPCEANTLNT